MKIKLEFSNPIYVSTAGPPCQLKVCFGDGSLFKTQKGVAIKEETCLKIRLSKQVGKDTTTESFEVTAETLKAVLEFLATGGPVLNFLFGFGTSNLWPMIEGMQLLVHYPMLKVDASANLGMF
jgi:hypothetical protein